mgnify:CR=1 FL=1
MVDARGASRFEGTAPEVRPGLRSGHIPGSCNVPYDALLDGEGRFLGADAIRGVFDAAGVTAEFNLNLLRVMNRDLGADFDTGAFRHRALYDPVKERIEMHLVSSRDQIVRIPSIDLTLHFAEGESIRTELSHKYTRDSVETLLRSGGLRLSDWFTDEEESFALALARLP